MDIGNATCDRQKPLVFLLDVKTPNEPAGEEPPQKKRKKGKKSKEKEKKAFFVSCHQKWLVAIWLAAIKKWQPAALLSSKHLPDSNLAGSQQNLAASGVAPHAFLNPERQASAVSFGAKFDMQKLVGCNGLKIAWRMRPQKTILFHHLIS